MRQYTPIDLRDALNTAATTARTALYWLDEAAAVAHLRTEDAPRLHDWIRDAAANGARRRELAAGLGYTEQGIAAIIARTEPLDREWSRSVASKGGRPRTTAARANEAATVRDEHLRTLAWVALFAEEADDIAAMDPRPRLMYGLHAYLAGVPMPIASGVAGRKPQAVRSKACELGLRRTDRLAV